MEKFEKVWRDFDNNPISHSVTHYLFAVYSLQEDGTLPRAVDISKKLGVSRNAVSLQLKSLQDNRLLTIDENHRIRLTDKGADVVNLIASKRLSFKTFLINILGVEPDTAEKDSCKVEHLLSIDTSVAFVRFINYVRSSDGGLNKYIEAFKHSDPFCECKSGCGICSNICLIKNATDEA